MTKFFSIAGSSPSGGEGGMNSRHGRRPMPSQEDLQSRFPDYYANRGDTSTSTFAKEGDRFKFRGDEAQVRHVENKGDGKQELVIQRSSQLGSGTYRVAVESGKDRKQFLGEPKRIFE